MRSNIPEVRLGIIAVSRDCFPIDLSERRRAAVVSACAGKGLSHRSEERRVGKECQLKGRSRWSPYH